MNQIELIHKQVYRKCVIEVPEKYLASDYYKLLHHVQCNFLGIFQVADNDGADAVIYVELPDGKITSFDPSWIILLPEEA